MQMRQENTMLSTGYDFFTAAEIVGVYRDVQND